ncbi:MAG: MFS transporter [Verrucomicrobiae bacterium]|nr:MFS transporter [Verrucomicrobiae bacterium]
MTTPPSSNRSLWSLLAAQTQVVFNDNAAKLMLIGLAQYSLPANQATKVISLLAAALVLPFILFAPTVGWLADRYPKQKVLNLALMAQVAIMFWIVGSVFCQSLWGAVLGFFLLAVQACVFSPAKQGILKELVGSERLGMAVGWLEMLTIVGILLGSVVGGQLFDHLSRSAHNYWLGGFQTAGILTAGAILAWSIFQGVHKTESQSSEPFEIGMLWRHFSQVGELWREKPLRLAALGIAYFYSFGGLLYLSFVQLGKELHAGQVGAVSDTGIFLGMLGGGVALGSVATALFCRKQIELGLIPIGGAGLTAGLAILSLTAPKSPPFYAGLMILGFFAGTFTVPLNAFLQNRAGDDRRARVISATNLLTNLGGIIAVGIYYLLAEKLHLNACRQFMLLILPSLAVALYVVWLLPESLLRVSVLFVTRCFYRIETLGLENLPKGGALLACNHVSYIDAIVLQTVCPRPIRFVAYEGFHRKWYLGWVFRILNVIPISSKHAKDAIRHVADALKDGELVCIFPEGQLTRTGALMGLRKGFELMSRHGNAPVVPIFMDCLWGSIFSFSENRFFLKIPRHWPYPVLVNIGKPIAPEAAVKVKVWKDLLDLNEESFSRRPELRGHLGYACLQALSRKPWKNYLVDTFPKPRRLSRAMTLAVSIALAQRWKKNLSSPRIGVVLPPGIGSAVANFALAIADKVPVNLNFTVGRSAAVASLERGGIKTLVSAKPLQDRFTEFPWIPNNTLDIVQEIKACGKFSIMAWFAAAWLLPSRVLAAMIGTPTKGNGREAILFFTSGSSGDPKGVVLTHRNVLGNVAQIAASNIMRHGDVMLGCLPLFHSFGYTVTLWYTALEGVRLVTVPSPLEVKKVGDAIRDEKATVLIGAPTFLRSYIRKVEPEHFRSLRLIVAGAEKLPRDIFNAFLERFGKEIHEGYGLTETTPVVSVNREDPPRPLPGSEPQIGHCLGSVGRLLPGITARITDPDTGKELPITATGMLHLRGANIFPHYLNDEARTREVLQDGWFKTGDLGRFDEDGFLYIEGRLSRFSKIGGEMVPHGTVEQRLIELLGLQNAETQPLVVVGVPDPVKGEALLVLSAVEITLEQVREKLTSAGLPNLWIPKAIKRVEKIPTLSTGKLDLKGCEHLARENTSADGRP